MSKYDEGKESISFSSLDVKEITGSKRLMKTIVTRNGETLFFSKWLLVWLKMENAKKYFFII